ncbi:MAG: hypothetical protein SFU98_19480 [Leptospiraceae bacterium]|nr:hypothetical protein [Leptospiraceae bacterium]
MRVISRFRINSCIIIIIFFFVSKIFSTDDYRIDSKSTYKDAREFLNSELFNKVNSNQSSNSEKIQLLTSSISEYYSQFIDDRRIEADRKTAGIFKKKSEKDIALFFRYNSGKLPLSSDVNSIRIFIQDMDRKLVSSYLIRESEELFFAHSKLCELYEVAKQKHKALEHCFTALRYKDFSTFEETILNKEPIPTELKTYSDKIKTKQVLEKEIIDLTDEIHLEESLQARNPSFATITQSAKRETLKQKKEELEKLKIDVKSESEKSFSPFKEKLSNEFSIFLIRFAKLSKELELEIREKEKIKKDSYPLITLNRESNFPFYQSILEFGRRVDPKCYEASYLLAEDFKNSGQDKKAIDYFLEYLKAENIKFKPSALESLAILYSNQKNFPNSKKYYEMYYDSIENSNAKKEATYHIGNFFLNKLGDYYTSKDYLANWLVLEEKEINDNWKDKSTPKPVSIESEKKQMIANLGIAKYFQWNKRLNEFETHLYKSYNNYVSLQKIYSDAKENLKQAKTNLDSLKNGLIYNTSEDLLEVYREEEEKFFVLNQEVNKIKALVDSLPKIELLNLLADLEEEKKDFKKSRNFLIEIQNLGIEPYSNIAMKNIQRIDSSFSDGIKRKKFE